MSTTVKTTIKLFVDLDGVLVDFDRGVLELTGTLPADIPEPEMWKRIAAADDFYNKLDWMEDGPRLWSYVRVLQPSILTGLPRGNWAEPQKRRWCERELGPEIPVFTCLTREKPLVAQLNCSPDETPVLIDDRTRIADHWREIGGIFIHHTSAASSTQQLEQVLEAFDL